uniref:Fibronectin type III-like domain-containing protein n=1 Tax=Chromera velia CCMP2878 TaxID=1169474 RepID=A0A0G4IEP3_9ALVE|eukprot:Cvel_13772.t1-p1 / transcript=Cvel_13772.t1 / gene=Cvel_13772 / organism=Chromera_velia_CCMP2878 / gene_product=Probable beta-D-xylosidase 5, putative / transcript_product=Probable beta-D-xylosidase 5, putative / location=Cvel_scaffold954:14932-21213(+) / protein_length=853 / sequence_SO=supercontig / SO=protein_coding / is_pseudo=false
MRSLFLSLLLHLFAVSAANAEEFKIPRACSSEKSRGLPFCDVSLPLEIRVDDLIGRLSLSEKALMLTARESPKGDVPRLDVPEYDWGLNCVHGVQSRCGTNCPTSFPAPVNQGASFNSDLWRDMAGVIGREARALWLEGVGENHEDNLPHIGLNCWSPNININRDPRWGRNMEVASECPHLNGLYGAIYSRALQEGEDPRYLQVAVTLKHWAAYSLDKWKDFKRETFDANVTRHDLADTYFPAFKRSVREGKAAGVMCSYNRINGVPACASRFLSRVLREAWHFDGYVTSDTSAVEWFVTHHNFSATYEDAVAASLSAGTDVCSGTSYEGHMEEAVSKGIARASDVDVALRHALMIRFRLGLFDDPSKQPYWHVAPSEVSSEKARALSLQMAVESLVMLQNGHGEGRAAKSDGGKPVLPLEKGTTVAVLGCHADAREAMIGNYNGEICRGRTYDCVESPREALTRQNIGGRVVGTAGVRVSSAASDSERADALGAVDEADAVVIFAGLDTSIEDENLDRESLRLPAEQEKFIEDAVAKASSQGKGVTLVLFNGGAVDVSFLKNREGVAVIEAFYPGVYGAAAVASVLFGDESPSGRMPVTTFEENFAETVSMASMRMAADKKSGYPGRTYRYFEGKPLWPFGFGLSYASFSLKWHGGAQGCNGVRRQDGALLMRADRADDFAHESSDQRVHCIVTVRNKSKSRSRKDKSQQGWREEKGVKAVLSAFVEPREVSIPPEWDVSEVHLARRQLRGFRKTTKLRGGEEGVVSLSFPISSFSATAPNGDVVVLPGLYALVLEDGSGDQGEHVLEETVRIAGDAPLVLEPFPDFEETPGGHGMPEKERQNEIVDAILLS